MNLDKYQQTYLIDLVKHQLKIERKLHADLKNISWETNLKEIIDILPDFEAIKALDLDGIIVTAPGENSDFVSRFFAPKFGILEDPVTGSAHCDLIPFWSNVFKKKYMLARQISERGGELKCTHLGDRVIIGGEAITYMKGELFL